MTPAVRLLRSFCAFRDLLDGKIPSDLALLQDTEIRQFAEQYATDQVKYFGQMNSMLPKSSMATSLVSVPVS